MHVHLLVVCISLNSRLLYKFKYKRCNQPTRQPQKYLPLMAGNAQGSRNKYCSVVHKIFRGLLVMWYQCRFTHTHTHTHTISIRSITTEKLTVFHLLKEFLALYGNKIHRRIQKSSPPYLCSGPDRPSPRI